MGSCSLVRELRWRRIQSRSVRTSLGDSRDVQGSVQHQYLGCHICGRLGGVYEALRRRPEAGNAVDGALRQLAQLQLIHASCGFQRLLDGCEYVPGELVRHVRARVKVPRHVPPTNDLQVQRVLDRALPVPPWARIRQLARITRRCPNRELAHKHAGKAP